MGSNRVPSGVNEAVESMHEGGSRVAILPASMGFGKLRIGEVPKNSTLIYQLELIKVKGLDKTMEVDWGDIYDDSDDVNEYDMHWVDSDDNSTYSNDTDNDYDESAFYMKEINEMMLNVSSRMDNMLHAPKGTVSETVSIVVHILAICFIIACSVLCGHWIYAQRKKRHYFTRLRQDYIDNEFEIDEL
eukprot:CAMPEP_0196576050 /NCGR_PEP_ID=MMETSP1081-20130531/5404_1 /TAXON_ID=36882 /ORGANISM="Pyramimonas amylifera, Strain CCMP720" /LENGTH=187 /DNA_ID=CAMNT_0041894547 /DNA_START=600 /DNA_END=1163 /DNA_ORIENTATION=+